MQNLIKLDRAVDINSDTLVSLSQWQENRSELLLTDAPIGVIINENESAIDADLALDCIAVIAFNFAKFADGRAFSQARVLRDTLNFDGDIRAMGDFMPDQVAFLIRCGFSSFDCRSIEEKDSALTIAGIVSNTYQSDAVEKKPSFRRN